MMRRQRGFIHMSGWDMLRLLVLLGMVGWGVIEGALFVARHLTIGWQ